MEGRSHRSVVEVSSAPAALARDQSFEEFFTAESRTLFRRMWLVCGDTAEAEEIAQEAFLRLWERWDRVQGLDDPTGYLYRTAMNVFRQRYRRAAVALRRVLSQTPQRDDFAGADARETVRRGLATLTPRQRAALVLTELLGFSSKEAGRALGIRPSTVRVLASQGRAAFRDVIGDPDA